MDVEKEIQDEAAVQHHLLDRLDLRIVTAPVQERAIVLVINGIAGNVENLLLEFDEFIFELDLVHRTIVGLFCVLFHAAKLRHEDAKEWQDLLFALNRQANRYFIEFMELRYWLFVSNF